MMKGTKTKKEPKNIEPNYQAFKLHFLVALQFQVLAHDMMKGNKKTQWPRITKKNHENNIENMG